MKTTKDLHVLEMLGLVLGFLGQSVNQTFPELLKQLEGGGSSVLTEDEVSAANEKLTRRNVLMRFGPSDL